MCKCSADENVPACEACVSTIKEIVRAATPVTEFDLDAAFAETDAAWAALGF